MAGRILLIEALSSHRILLTAALKRARYNVTAVATGRAALKEVAENAPDIIVLGAVPDDTGQLADALTKAHAVGETPLLVLDNDATPSRRLAAMRSGARDLLRRPTPERLLLAHVRQLMREGETLRELALRRQAAMSFGMSETPGEFAHQRDVVFVSFGRPLPAAISEPIPSVRTITADQALDISDPATAPAAYILDASGPVPDDALSLLPELRARAHSRHAAMLVIHAPDDIECAINALNIGAGDLMPSDGTASELGLRIAKLLRRKADQDALRRSTEASLRLAVTDPLTGLYNRRYADAYLSDALVRAKVASVPFAVLVIDIDHFKAVNDTHGHSAGDSVLVEVAHRIRGNLRGSDMIARMGGEEFLVIMTETDPDRAGPAADRLRALVCDTPVLTDRGRINVSVSIGVALANPAQELPEARQIVADADAALYRAKNAGRNRIELTVAVAQRLRDGPRFNSSSRRSA